MIFVLSSTFTDSLTKLSADEQKQVKTTAFDLQVNPANPGHSFHKLDNAKDKNFWSIRVSRDIRVIVHRTNESLMLCYAAHHDDAYRWAARRRLENHPRTGAAQFVEVRETIKEVEVSTFKQPAAKKLKLFDRYSDSQLLDWGVPGEWIEDVKECDEDTILDLCEYLPQEAAETLLEIATGGRPPAAKPAAKYDSAFAHPDAQRRFRILANSEELAQALDFPWDKWIIFLHPDQRALVEAQYNGPFRVSGSAGTGKTIISLHRAVYLAQKSPDSRVALLSFSEPLANSLRNQLFRLISSSPRLSERIDVYSMRVFGERLSRLAGRRDSVIGPVELRELVEETARSQKETQVQATFVWHEYEHVVDAWNIRSWEEYRDIVRLGRQTRLPESKRRELWSIFERINRSLSERSLVTESGMYAILAEHWKEQGRTIYDHIIVDESQDISPQQLGLLSTIASPGPDNLFFSGDIGQRISRQPFSWKAMGVDLRGRSTMLKVNYRTSHQIRQHADKLLPPELNDADGNQESRSGTISVFNGPPPLVLECSSPAAESDSVSEWIRERLKEGISAEEICVVIRSLESFDRAHRIVFHAEVPFVVLDEQVKIKRGSVSICTMDLAKGLEFKAVAVVACDDAILPDPKRIEAIADEADLEDIYNTERNLLYVACTRARDHLAISGVTPVSEFVEDLRIK